MARPNPTVTIPRSQRELAVRDEIISLARELAGDDFHRFVEKVYDDGMTHWRIELHRARPYPDLFKMQGKLGDHLRRLLPEGFSDHFVTVHGPNEL